MAAGLDTRAHKGILTHANSDTENQSEDTPATPVEQDMSHVSLIVLDEQAMDMAIQPAQLHL